MIFTLVLPSVNAISQYQLLGKHLMSVLYFPSHKVLTPTWWWAAPDRAERPGPGPPFLWSRFPRSFAIVECFNKTQRTDGKKRWILFSFRNRFIRDIYADLCRLAALRGGIHFLPTSSVINDVVRIHKWTLGCYSSLVPCRWRPCQCHVGPRSYC